MKKQIKILMVVILCLSILVLPISVFASNTAKLTKKTYVKTGSGSTVVSKFKLNKGYAYCITPGKNGPSVGTKMHVKNTIKKGGLVYLLDQADSSDSSFVVTQLAVWKYASNYKRSASSSNWSKANKLVSKAKKNSNYSTTPSVKIKVANSNLHESGNYYKSDKITITAKNIKKDLNVKLENAPEGAKIVDVNGNKKTSFKNGDIIYVYIPSANVKEKRIFSIKISGTGYEKYVERYKSNNSKHQELVVLIKETKKVKDTAGLEVNPIVRKCVYHDGKYYGKDGKEVDKTTYEQECLSHVCEKVGDKYYGKDGREVDSATFDLECNEHTCAIIDGNYFDLNGNIVDEATYKEQCEPKVVPVPDTADLNGLIYILIGTLLIGSTVVTINTLSKSKVK